MIDVGGGSSILAGRLVDAGYAVTVLDISSEALQRARSKLGHQADRVRWVVADVTRVDSVGQFDVWHDRAVFHFLTSRDDRQAYASLAERTLPPGAHLIVATFAPDGPTTCSGLPVCRYDGRGLAQEFGSGFMILKEVPETHVTPGGKPQAFTYAMFRRV